MDDCIFCKIVNKRAPAKIVFEDEFILGLVPLEEVTRGHTLLISKTHFENIFDVDETIFDKLTRTIRVLSKKLVSENQATGMNILNANGTDAQQSVMHLHFHLVPRYPNDGLDMWIKQKLL